MLKQKNKQTKNGERQSGIGVFPRRLVRETDEGRLIEENVRLLLVRRGKMIRSIIDPLQYIQYIASHSSAATISDFRSQHDPPLPYKS